MSDEPIYVTQPWLPPLEEFMPYLQQIWHSRILTNRGPFYRQFEQALCDFLQVEHVALCANGTIALSTALHAAGLEGEVITSPYSFPATAHVLANSNLTPVFADIDPMTFCLDAATIEPAITPRTAAIMPVHVYGNTCDTRSIKAVADKGNLRVIYDAAHAFGVQDDAGSVLKHGDFSALSFHATKVFNTFEGGAIVCADRQTKELVDKLNNFGIADETTVVAAGLNGKMDEFKASLGLLQLKHFEQLVSRRKMIDASYREQLGDIPGITLMQRDGRQVSNFSYFPILVEPGYPLDRDSLYEKLKSRGIFSRRYFYPLISNLPMYRNLPSADPANLPVANAISNKVLCLPIYSALSDEQVEKVVGVLKCH